MRSTRWIAGVVTLVCAAVLASLAVVSQGYPVRKLDLNDSGVWVTNDAQRMFGRVNKSAGGLDAWVDAPGGGARRQLDILQDASAAVQFDPVSKVLTPMDTASVTNMNDAALVLPPTAVVDMRGGTLAILDAHTGSLFAMRYDPKVALTSLHALDLKEGALAELGKGPEGLAAPAAVSVSDTGTIQAVSANGKLVTIKALEGGFAKPEVKQLSQALRSVQVAAVGDQAAVFDAEQGTLVLPDGKAKQFVEDATAVVQQGGPASDHVLMATSTRLYRVKLADGESTEIAYSVDGAPAAPVRLLGCDFGAWAGPAGGVVRGCGTGEAEPLASITEQGGLTRPIFRVNRQQIVLNDAADGRAFDLATMNRVDMWDQIKPKPNESNQNPNEQVKPSTQEAKPVANPDVVGARAGRVTVGHLLDNDTDALGQILMITAVDGVPEGAKVDIAPNGQSVAITPPKDETTFGFRYTISNGVNSASSSVQVKPVGADENQAPKLRPGYEEPEHFVASFGTLPLSVLGDWRDPDGDALTLVSAEVDGQPVPVTPEGRIEYVAGREEAKVVRTLKYQVTDGTVTEPVVHEVPITILEAKSLVGTPPVTFPDAVRGVAGRPVTFNPLANDIPGSDPRTPDARLRLGGDVRGEGGLSITTNQSSGQVSALATMPGSYELAYTAAFGSSAMQTGKIRLDIYPDDSDLTPVAMPDAVTMRGPQAVRLDPLANDADPVGGMLTVTSAEADSELVEVAIVSGRWVLVTPKSTGQSSRVVIRYTVTNGTASAVGTITVAQLPALPDAPPIVKDDLALVRAGDSVLVNALTNDVAQNGEQLTLVTNSIENQTVGELRVFDPASTSTDATEIGRAFIFNNQIRYVAPAALAAERQVVIEYQAQTPNGTRSSTGKVIVTIKPEPTTPDENRAPTPNDLEVRLTGGETAKISLPTSGQDPDGDNVVVAGLLSAPKLGRIRGVSPTSITYEAFPNIETFGTDSFNILLADRYGKTSPALVRIGITPPGQAQPPVAIDDNITVAPGLSLRVDAMANDLYSRADNVTIQPLDVLNDQLPAGVTLESETGPVKLQAPEAKAQPTLLSYALRGNAGVGVPGSIKVVAEEGYQIPPVIFDEVAKAEGQLASVDVLERAWDPDGADEALKVSLLGGPPEATVVGGKITVPLTERIQFVPYQVTDATGATSAALVFVPSSGSAAPHLKAGGLIEVGQNQSVTLNLDDYVYSPRERRVSFVPASDVLFGSPQGKLEVEVTGKNTFKVSAKADYIGPGAVTFQVMDGDSLTEEGVLSATISIPVQVGPATPVLRCPEHTVTLVAGGKDANLDIASLCHVWAPNPADVASMEFSAQWEGRGIEGVQFDEGHVIKLRAGGGALPGSEGVLMIGAKGTDAVKRPINVAVRAAGPPSMRSRTFNDIKQGTALRVPLGIESPLRDAKPHVIAVSKVSGPEVSYQVNGTTLTITPGNDSHGDVVLRVLATDILDETRTDRQVSATITLSVYGRPDAPGAPQPGQRAQSKAESLTWTIPANNGAPITEYEVEDSTGRKHACASNSCQITGLKNGTPIKFKVRAKNKADWSEFSAWSKEITPDQPPPAPTGLKVTNPQDRKVTLSWNKVVVDGTAVHTYHLMINGKVIAVPGSQTSYVVPMPDNNNAYEIALTAENDYDKGPTSRVTGQSAGKPLGLKPPTFQPTSLTGAATAVTITWNRPDKNGPHDLTFKVVRDGSKTICSGVAVTTCTDDRVTFDGATHTYVVTATNGAGGAEHSSSATGTWAAVGTPDKPAAPTVSATGADRTLNVSGTTPASRGKQATLKIFANGAQVYSGAVSPSGQSINQNITVGANGTAYAVTLQLCNELRCTTSSGSSATPYGPIRNLTIRDAGTSGTTVSYTVSVDPNGKPVTVIVNGRSWTTGTGPWSTTVRDDLGGYEISHPYTATARDGTREATPATVTLTSGPKPPAPSVTLELGEQRNVDGVSGEGGCITPYCHDARITTRNFSGDVSCRIYARVTSPSDVTWDETVSMGGNTTKRSTKVWGYPDSQVTVTCKRGSESASATKSPWK